MDIVCPAFGIVNPFHPVQGMKDIAKAGFQNIVFDLGMCCSGNELEYYGKPKKEEEKKERLFLPVSEYPSEIPHFFDQMLLACSQAGLKAFIARTPCLPRDTKRTDLREQMIKIQKECIRFCGKIGCPYLVIRPLYAGVLHGDWEFNRKYYLALAAAAKENDVMILLENQCRSLNGHMVRSTCADSEEAAEWVDALNKEAGEERYGFCLDVGVCSLCGQDMYECSKTLEKRIKAVILRDCDGQNEGAMLPFTCVRFGKSQTDWLRLIRGLRETGFDGQLVLDIADTAMAFSPLLRPQLLAFAKETAEYFRWQIEIENLLKKYQKHVLFGAGNMCRNYMKCYGEKYPPLFTCDNNEKLWGSTFCGLEVRPPEVLKELPKDCGVFICNVYYREIEQQLRSMGIENIEFFNDEYMPSFYFDRLERV